VSGLWLLVGLIVLFSILRPDTFPTTFTLKSVGSDQAVTGLIALALLVPFVTGTFDLSVGAAVGLTGMVSASLVATHHVPAWAAILLTLLVGVGIGIVNGFLVAVVRIDSFIATLGTGAMIAGAVRVISNNQYIVGLPSSFTAIGTTSLFGVSILVWVLVVVVAAVWYVLEQTPLGRHLYALGGNREAARLGGVRTQALVFGSLIVCGLLAATAGVLETASLDTGDPTMGPSYLLPAFAAVFLGATQIRVGRVNALGTILAVYLLAVGERGLLLLGAPPYVDDFFNGGALVVAVAITLWTGNLRRTGTPRRRLAGLLPIGRHEPPQDDVALQEIYATQDTR
jgi:ribose transport system permease protein